MAADCARRGNRMHKRHAADQAWHAQCGTMPLNVGNDNGDLEENQKFITSRSCDHQLIFFKIAVVIPCAHRPPLLLHRVAVHTA
jgi:hypothetical protein